MNQYLLYVQEVLAHFILVLLLYEFGQDFLDRRYVFWIHILKISLNLLSFMNLAFVCR